MICCKESQMPKRKKGKNKYEEDKKKEMNTLPVGKYTEEFESLKKGEKRTLKDSKSDKNSYMPIEICDEEVYLTEPDGKLIPSIPNQHKCDFLIYCQKVLQTCFIELKGNNISVKDGYNPYDQIIDTIKFLRNEDELKEIVAGNIEKHAFIVSPGRQKIPKGIETKERALWQQLIQNGNNKGKILELIHYVKVTKSDRYSNNGQIICSPKSPVQLPFLNLKKCSNDVTSFPPTL